MRSNSSMAFLVLCIAVPAGSRPLQERAPGVTVDAAAAVRYVFSHRRANAAFGPDHAPHTDLAWTYPAVHALLLLGQDVPSPRRCLESGQKTGGRTRFWSFYQKARLNALLGGTPPAPSAKSWTLEYVKREKYGEPFRHGAYYDLASLWQMVSALSDAKGEFADPDEPSTFVLRRQAAGGAFGEAYDPSRGVSAHVVSTCQAVMTLKALGRAVPHPDRCVAWVRSCQDVSGGFRRSPDSADPGNRPDVWYTLAAVRALEALGSTPGDADACARWLNGLQNADGGFGDRPGWTSRLYSTYYAVHALAALTGDARSAIKAKEVKIPRTMIPEGLSIFQAHHKSPPRRSGNGRSRAEDGVPPGRRQSADSGECAGVCPGARVRS